MLRVEGVQRRLVHRLHHLVAIHWQPPLPHPRRPGALADDSQELQEKAALVDGEEMQKLAVEGVQRRIDRQPHRQQANKTLGRNRLTGPSGLDLQELPRVMRPADQVPVDGPGKAYQLLVGAASPLFRDEVVIRS